MNAPSEAPFAAARQREVVDALNAVLPPGAVLFNEEDTRPYECDGLAAYRQLPMIVVLPANEEQVIAAINVCRRLKAPIVPRGAGTGLQAGEASTARLLTPITTQPGGKRRGFTGRYGLRLVLNRLLMEHARVFALP
jgi:hypothetical protein